MEEEEQGSYEEVLFHESLFLHDLGLGEEDFYDFLHRVDPLPPKLTQQRSTLGHHRADANSIVALLLNQLRLGTDMNALSLQAGTSESWLVKAFEQLRAHCFDRLSQTDVIGFPDSQQIYHNIPEQFRADLGDDVVAVLDTTPVFITKPTTKTVPYPRDYYCGLPKVKDYCVKHTVISAPNGVLYFFGPQRPGSYHDLRMFRLDGVDEELPLIKEHGHPIRQGKALADLGYVSREYHQFVVTPFRKPAGAELADAEKRFNSKVYHHRAVVENVNARLKQWATFNQRYDVELGLSRLKKQCLIAANVAAYQLKRTILR